MTGASTGRSGGRAVVLGGSMAGLLAARTLSDSFGEVVVVDRDPLTDGTGPRRGVPQGRHAHGLVAQGQQILEGLFPGLTEELIGAGVQVGDFSGDIRWYFGGRRMRPTRSGLLSLAATRPVLEDRVRRRVFAIPGVVTRTGHSIDGLVTDRGGRRVVGARVTPEGGEPTTLEADLVVDATGRGSRTPVWLEELGYERPPEERVGIRLAYTTRHYRLNCDPFGDDIAIIPAATPSHPRGAFFYPVPGGHVQLSLTGVLGDHPPTDPEGYTDYVRSLPIPDIHRAIADAEPLDDPVTIRFPASVRRRYEALNRFPEGFVVVGDAVCSFNPVYAQGMTVAAREALTLRRHVSAPRPLSARRFFADVARDVQAPWDLAAGSDLGYPGVEGRRTPLTRLVNAYTTRLQQAAVHDARLSEAFVRAAGLVAPPQSIMRPSLLLRVARHSLIRPGRPGPQSPRLSSALPRKGNT
ncbi:NAD(P)/FAD-dependent oxidoreductase [Nocardiopsis sp. FIRDI 009]|uniref:NAD(P)/FAD-dependent oxidoreductase n=1 Tax=Nocardiopsis sp. FIRDI 009 TaxID=714197 RepID=UPI0018E52216|nr:FAD-dependent monooxygenase [Nocardiopsis sp. FIRDI 009]